MNRAGAAEGFAASEFGAGKVEQISQYPKQRHVFHCFYSVGFAINLDGIGGHDSFVLGG
jgi:hypothetical protein